LKVLIVGLGSIAKKHIAAIRLLNSNSVFFSLRSGQKFDINDNIININEITQVPNDIDFILISNPTSAHSSSIFECLHFKKPLIIEKPVFDKIYGNQILVDLISKNQIKTYIACNMRFHPIVVYLKDLLSKNDKKINEVNIYCGSFMPDWRPNKDYKKSYSALTDMGGGVHLDLIHELDYSIWIFGKPKNIYSIKRKVSNLQIDSIDYAYYNLFYDDFNLSIALNYYRKKPKRQIEILLENEILSCDLLKCVIYDSNDNIIFHRDNYSIIDTYLNQMKYFISNLNSEIPYMNDINESFDVLKFALNEESQ
jgi:predicted dehydrogenase